MTKEKERHFSFFLSGKTGGAKRRISRKRVTDFYSYIELSVVVLYFFQVFSSSAFVITSFIISQYTHYTLHPQIYIYTLFLLLFKHILSLFGFHFQFFTIPLFIFPFSFWFSLLPFLLPSSTFCSRKETTTITNYLHPVHSLSITYSFTTFHYIYIENYIQFSVSSI